jgi:hypothetical protein
MVAKKKTSSVVVLLVAGSAIWLPQLGRAGLLQRLLPLPEILPAPEPPPPSGYDPNYCGGPDGSPPPSFSTAIDLPIILADIGLYTLDPSQLYGPDDPWTNWYETNDMREALAKLASMRTILEDNNLWDTYRFAEPDTIVCPASAATNRQIDGTCNDPDKTWMGSAGARFGRNMDPTGAFAQADANLMSPNPREISRALFTRDEMKEVPFLNMLAAAWIQFQVHDWFAHTNTTHDFFQIPMSPDDPLYNPARPTMMVPKTATDPTRTAVETAMGPTYPNEVTHWWDGSQIYGSDAATAARLRTFEGGHLRVDANGLVPTAADGFEDTGFRQNWWVGLGLLHNLFTQEHNAVADRLAGEYPGMSDQELYDKARMVTAAVIAKIHTIEWTPAILPNPTLEVGMNANWDGLNEYLYPQLIEVPPQLPLPYRHVLFGVRGGPRELHTDPATGGDVPFSLTEEFVSVYRMHTLLPDTLDIKSPADGVCMESVALEDSRDKDARKLEERYGMNDLLYSFGIQHPGALVLGNYPSLLQNLQIPHVGAMDIGAVDVLRDRERGIPRYNEFRRQLNLLPLESIDELTPDADSRAALKAVYGDDDEAIERVDLLVGTLAEGERPSCYGFGETLFQVFTLMATRRLHGDRFYTEDYTAEVYTQAGLDWIEAATMKSVLLRHYPALGSTGLGEVTNAFYPWE